MSLSWFERLTGFREGDYDDTRARLSVDGQELLSLENGARYGIGRRRPPVPLRSCELSPLTLR